ncbi:uncharacterized protein LOC119690177 [Teleopsis dalmanni]|uniref:uncharacterized protein LOC119690177 n=1 Tax=Teleopsis dalmanni TaxID=139649 RepID=UPI0018CD44A8|nr:uncharacterized protein LOC119690177 [Teleopsis dalmanni]
MEGSITEPPRKRFGQSRKNINTQRDKEVYRKLKRKYVRRKHNTIVKTAPQKKCKGTAASTYPTFPTYLTGQPICVHNAEFVDLLLARKEQAYPNMPGRRVYKRVNKIDNEKKEIKMKKVSRDAVDDWPRRFRAYKHLSSPAYENWFFNGVLPAIKYDKEKPVSTNQSDVLKKVNYLTGNLIEVKESIKSLKVKTEIAEKDEDPKLHLWAHKWNEKESNKEELKFIKTTSGTEEEVTKEICKRNLLDHVTTEQKAIENILNEMEGNIKALEAKMKADNIPPLDLETFKKMFQH